jgi:mannose-6-phosphate isomerase-like protein (cupin superfamily)
MYRIVNEKETHLSDQGTEHWRITPAEAMAAPRSPGSLAAELLSYGTMKVEYYAPAGRDTQTPHSRDELYVIVRGSGWFVNGERRHPFAAGDVLFVPAGNEHRFEEFSDDFGTWVIFYGPEGGESC